MAEVVYVVMVRGRMNGRGCVDSSRVAKVRRELGECFLSGAGTCARTVVVEVKTAVTGVAFPSWAIFM
jgi:hypothetical protein